MAIDSQFERKEEMVSGFNQLISICKSQPTAISDIKNR